MDFKLKEIDDKEVFANIRKIVNLTGNVDCSLLYYKMLCCDAMAEEEHEESYYTDDEKMMDDFCRIFHASKEVVTQTFGALQKLDLLEVA